MGTSVDERDAVGLRCCPKSHSSRSLKQSGAMGFLHLGLCVAGGLTAAGQGVPDVIKLPLELLHILPAARAAAALQWGACKALASWQLPVALRQRRWAGDGRFLAMLQQPGSQILHHRLQLAHLRCPVLPAGQHHCVSNQTSLTYGSRLSLADPSCRALCIGSSKVMLSLLRYTTAFVRLVFPRFDGFGSDNPRAP